MDERGNAMRLSFSIREDVHKGMRRMHDFTREALTDHPMPNPYMPGVESAEDFIFPTVAEMDKVVADSRDGAEMLKADSERVRHEYRGRVKSKLPAFYRESVTRGMLDDMLDKAAGTIQKKWRDAKSEWLAAAAAADVAGDSARVAEEALSSAASAAAMPISRVALPPRVASREISGGSATGQSSPIRPLRRPMSSSNLASSPTRSVLEQEPPVRFVPSRADSLLVAPSVVRHSSSRLVRPFSPIKIEESESEAQFIGRASPAIDLEGAAASAMPLVARPSPIVSPITIRGSAVRNPRFSPIVVPDDSGGS
jgi:hypothetical protein